MNVKHLGLVKRKRQNAELHAFLATVGNDIEQIGKNGKKVVLIGGACDVYFKVEALLYANGIKVDCYSDNSLKMKGRMYGGREVLYSYDLFTQSNVYFIIAAPLPRVNDIRLQFGVFGVTEYGFYFEATFHDFEYENAELKSSLMESINEIFFSGEDTQALFPILPNGCASSDYNRTLGGLDFFMYSPVWSHYIYLWEREILRERKGRTILEIGPGIGLMSATLLEEFTDLNIDWVLFGYEEESLERCNQTDLFTRSLKKVKKKYNDRIHESWGYIERPSFRLPSEKYDMVIMTEVFEHFIVNPVDTMKKIRDSMKGDGCLLFTTPNWGHIHLFKTWKDLPKNENICDEEYLSRSNIGHIYQYNRDELEDIFAQSGFSAVKYAVSDCNNHNYLLRKG